jgi:hypothetical protein
MHTFGGSSNDVIAYCHNLDSTMFPSKNVLPTTHAQTHNDGKICNVHSKGQEI